MLSDDRTGRSGISFTDNKDDRTGRSGISFTDNKKVFVLGADSPRLVRGLAAAPMGS